MVTLAFALFDTKAAVFNVPFFFGHRGQAVRAVLDLGSDRSTVVGRHPSDFILFEIGSFDDQTGVLAAGRPENLGTVVSFLAAPEKSGAFAEAK